MPDTVPGDSSTTVVLDIGSTVTTTIDTAGDRDWYRVTLVAGHSYSFATNSVNQDDVDSYLRLYNSGGTLLAEDDDGAAGTFSEIHFTATTSGTYYIAGGTFEDRTTGTFLIRATDTAASGADTIAGDVTTTSVIALDGTANSSIDRAGDHDFYRVTLVAGQSYLFQTQSTGGAGDVDSTIMIRNASGADRDGAGNEYGYNDDRVGTYSGVRFTPTTSGTYYIDVAGWNDQETGTYRLNMITAPPLEVYTNDQIAHQLTDDYWSGNRHHFDVVAGGTLTFNVSGLGTAAANLARQALLLWTDVTGITFSEVTSGGQILFTNTEEGASTGAVYSGGITTSATVNVSQAWVTQYGTGLNSYSFQTFIHEIGHALGLGHGGPYNGTADYPSDAAYLNDAWITTVMSYFDENENTYFDNLGFTRQYTVSPMVADGLAIASLYGANTLTRTGDTVYGFNSNAGRDIYDATKNANVAYTVFDNGGVDTLDYSGFGQAQTINLTQEQFSSVGGRTGNVSIARGAVIENAIGGSGADLMIGNDVANKLTGGLGDDTLIGLAGDDILDGGAGNDKLNGGLGNDTYYVVNQGDVIYEAAGEGTDTAYAFDNFQLYANVENLVLYGALGHIGVGNELDNVITGNDVGDRLLGGLGNDTINGGAGNDWIYGEDGNDTLWGGAGVDYLVGDNGNDVLHGENGAGEQDFLYGWAGNDTYYVDAQNDFTFEDVNGGTDTVYANFAGGTYYLFANVENLILQGTTLYGVGNELANTITGSDATNWLLGGAGNDRIDGGKGDDVLFGQDGNDTFVFGAGSGIDTIGDFTPGTDKIDLSAYGFANFAAVQAAMTDQGGGIMNIALGGGNYIILIGVAKAQLASGDFILSTSQAPEKAEVMAPASSSKGAPVMAVDGGGKGDAQQILLPAHDDALAGLHDVQQPAGGSLAEIFHAGPDSYEPTGPHTHHFVPYDADLLHLA
ncbi:M10 family metallopeptidase C-terminal domain-containing protein [Sphingomonas sp. R-74633]|uniref:M10 family metallopeptidase C-terminal domain-containing protein n=1 Tax=Sphingomonas sp. R-74633 TaxID=2751188 RepID=UPI0015D0D607|nr:M10 family metallopeptidase C-terminal domain-containing protein [Sphingomonas sp. R-74633]NYT42882.1 M10 family metallopeptidase C-terminal domain-containing protein [Sphingomonas sp. R-74633]